MIKIFKNFIDFKFLNSKYRDKILKIYYHSIIYRKKHIKKDNFSWLKDIKIINLNEKEGKLYYKNFQFVFPKNDIKSIPLHQKYLYAALINYFKIPKYYLLFWDDLVIFHEIFIEKIYDKVLYVKKGDVILDIGASIGWYACKISDLVGENGKIIAIEPDPENFHYLKKNIEINNLKNVSAINLGVWSSKNKMNLICEKYVSLLEPLQIISDSNKVKNSIQINVDSIDNIILNLKLDIVNLIKMDIEGAEIEAIKGAKTTLMNLKMLNLIISAYHKNSFGKESYRILIPYLEKYNFKIIRKHLPIIYAQKL